MEPRKDVRVLARAARATFSVQGLRDAVLFDPERPNVGPNELLKEMGGKLDPRKMLHGCPFCPSSQPPMPWEVFAAHMKDTDEGPGCMTRWFNTVDITHRRFAGASIGDTHE